MSGALGNVRSYNFGDYEVVDYCVIHGSRVVLGEVRVFFLVFMCGLLEEGRKRSYAMMRVW